MALQHSYVTMMLKRRNVQRSTSNNRKWKLFREKWKIENTKNFSDDGNNMQFGIFRMNIEQRI